MGHEIKIGDVSLVVDDPLGQLARSPQTELRVEHQDAESLEASVRTVQNRPSAPTINTVDPIGSLHARAHLVEKIVSGKPALAPLLMAWLLFGPPLILFAAGIGYRLLEDWHQMRGAPLRTLMIFGLTTETGIAFCFFLLIRRTARMVRERRCSNIPDEV